MACLLFRNLKSQYCASPNMYFSSRSLSASLLCAPPFVSVHCCWRIGLRQAFFKNVHSAAVHFRSTLRGGCFWCGCFLFCVRWATLDGSAISSVQLGAEGLWFPTLAHTHTYTSVSSGMHINMYMLHSTQQVHSVLLPPLTFHSGSCYSPRASSWLLWTGSILETKFKDMLTSFIIITNA